MNVRNVSARTNAGIRSVSGMCPLYPTRPDPTRPVVRAQVVCGVSGTTSIDLTVGLDSPPDAWMETDDLDLLDDDVVHRCCHICYPEPWLALTTFVAICGKRAIGKEGGAAYVATPNDCPACDEVDYCPKCGR